MAESVRFQCSSCGALHSVFKKAVGLRVRCPTCNELTVVEPYVPPAAVEEDEEPLVELEALPEPAPAAWREMPAEAPPVLVPEPAPPPARSTGPARRAPVVFRPERKDMEAEMDMTPMVDVTFLLLIFFMVTASFTMQKSLNIPKPESTEPSSQARSIQDFQDNPDYVVVRVDEYNTFHVSAAAWEDEIEAPNEQELLVKLRQARQGDGQGNVPAKMLVMANGEALHERVVMAIDAGNDVGMEEVQLVTVEGDE